MTGYLPRRGSIAIMSPLYLVLSYPGLAMCQPVDAAVTQSWRDRQAKVRSLRCKWTARDTIPKGSLSVGIPGAPENNPPRDLLIDAQAQLVLDGGKLRYTYHGKDWSAAKNDLVQRSYTSMFDGKIEKLLITQAGMEYPQGRVAAPDRPGDSTAVVTSPLTIFCRGLDKSFRSFDLEEFAPTGRELIVNDRRCVELKSVTRANQATDTLFLDRERGYLLVRRIKTAGTKTTLQLTIKYAPDSSVGWAPQSWDYLVRLPSGALVRSVQCSVTKLEINPDTVADDFSLAFPPGTRVSDRTSGTEMQFVVQGDGQPGKSIPTAENPTYEQLRDAGPPSRSMWVWIVVPALVFLLSLAGWIAVKRRQTAPEQP